MERLTAPAHRVVAARALVATCSSATEARRVAAVLAEAADRSVEAGRPSDAVSYLEALVQPPFTELVADAIDRPAIEARIRELLWPTFRSTRRSRFERRFRDGWIERGIYDPETDLVRVAGDDVDARLTALALEAAEHEAGSAEYTFEATIDGDSATIPLVDLIRVVYEDAHGGSRETDREEP